MTEEIPTTMKAYPRDVAKLLKLFGAPQPRAFHLAMNQCEEGCPHPFRDQCPTTAIVPVGCEVITKDSPTRTLVGFLCNRCHTFVFPENLNAKAQPA